MPENNVNQKDSSKTAKPEIPVDSVVMCVGDYEHTITWRNDNIYQKVVVVSRNIDKSLSRQFTIEFNRDGSLAIEKFDWRIRGDHNIYIRARNHHIDIE